jgi:protein-tyrosine phosphatase
MVNVLFVCMGNICRSPTAEGVFISLVQKAGLQKKIGIDSAGTHAYHVGEPPDPRAQKTARARGIDISHLRARRAIEADFERFDYVLAMDMDNLKNLQAICPEQHTAKLSLLLDYASHSDVREVPDPYYGGPLGFERVLDMVEDAAHGLLQNILEQHPHIK